MPDLKPIRQRDPLRHSDSDLLRIMEEDWERSDSHYKQMLDDAKEDWKRYLMIKGTEDEPTISEQGTYDPRAGARANLKLPTLRKHISTAISLIMNSLHPTDSEWLHAYPMSDFTGADYETLADDIEKYRQFRIHMLSASQMAYWQRVEGFLLQGLIFPWSIMLLTWRTEGRFRRKRQQSVDEGLTQALSKPEKGPYDMDLGYEWDPAYIDRADASVLHTANTRPDPRGGMMMRDLAYLMDELRVPWYELYENQYDPDTGQGIYYNLDALEEAVPRDDTTETPEEIMRADLGEGPQEGTVSEDKKKESFRNTVRLVRYWTKFGVVTADADYNVIIGKRRYEQLPLWDFKATIDWTKFDAQSFARMLRGLDDCKDMLINYRLNNLSFGIDGVVPFDGTRINENSRGKPINPGTQIEFDGPVNDAISVIRTNDVSQQTFNDGTVIDTEIEGAMGQSQNTLGQYFGGGRRLATEVQTVAVAAANRGGQLVERIQSTVITPQQNYLTFLESDRMTRQKEILIVKEGKFRNLAITQEFVQAMASQIWFEAKGADYVNHQQIQAAGVMNAANVLGNNPIFMQLIDPRAMAARIIRNVARDPKPESWFKRELDDVTSIPPHIEWVLLMGHGIKPEIHANDNDEQHLVEHQMQLVRSGNDRSVSDEVIQALIKHIEETNQKMAAEQMAMTAQRAPQPGPVYPTLPGQEGSQETQGTQGANLMNPQPAGVGPPQKTGVTQ